MRDKLGAHTVVSNDVGEDELGGGGGGGGLGGLGGGR